jgi:acetyltransferase-like isoleucine patch superfamily enzyme
MSRLFNPGYYEDDDLKNAGFKSIGRNVRIAKNCTIIGLENISIGNNVRIDGYCTLIASREGDIILGSFVQIATYSFLAGADGIVMEDFCGLAQGVKIYSRSDDYTGMHLTNQIIPRKYSGVTGGRVTLRRHVIIGSGSVILPKVTIGEGSSVGALSLVTKNLGDWGVYFGCPVKKLKSRSKRLLELEKQLLAEMKG